MTRSGRPSGTAESAGSADRTRSEERSHGHGGSLGGRELGRLDSTKTRVAPVFDRLLHCDPTGTVWLDRLIRLGSRASEVDLPSSAGELKPDHRRTWGEGECRLPPPLGLLEWLVQNIKAEDVEKARPTSEETRQKRLALARRDPDVLQEALARLRAGERERAWFVLEGLSSPDAYLDTDSLVVAVEGKRTEQSLTCKTTFMAKRSQLIRHMDAAWKIADGRRVLGLLLVEGESPNPMLVPDRWSTASDQQLQPTSLEPSWVRLFFVGGPRGGRRAAWQELLDSSKAG